MSRPKLTPKQAAFVNEYLIDLNAAAAARRAGYSEKTARKIGQENLTKPDIAAAIEKAQAERAAEARLTAQDVLDGLRTEATRTGEGSSHSARVAAWGHLGKYFSLFVDKTELSGPGGAPLAAGVVHFYLPGNNRDEIQEGEDE